MASSGVKTFEELHIFQQAREMCKEVWQATRSGPFSRDLALVNQIRRSTVSIVSNIAEGFERESEAEFARFLMIAKGSCGEARAQLLIALDQRYVTKEQFLTFSARSKQVSAGLANLARYLRNSRDTKRRKPSG